MPAAVFEPVSNLRWPEPVVARQRRRRGGLLPVRLTTFGVTVRSQVGRSSQRACQPPSSSCSSRIPGSQSDAVAAAVSAPTSARASVGSSAVAGRTVTVVTSSVGARRLGGALAGTPSRRRPGARRAEWLPALPRPSGSLGRLGRPRPTRPARGSAAGSAGARRGARPPARTRGSWRRPACPPPSGSRAPRSGRRSGRRGRADRSARRLRRRHTPRSSRRPTRRRSLMSWISLTIVVGSIPWAVL